MTPIKKQKNIIVFVMGFATRYAEAIRQCEEETSKKYRIMLLRDSKLRYSGTVDEFCDLLVECDFSKPWKIAEALLPYQDELLAITCRQEQHLARFAQVIPHVPYLRTPTTDSLAWAADKYEMRKRMQLFDKKNTPKFTKVLNTTKAEQDRIIEKVGFPMMIKPANLMGARFVTVCYHEEELEKTLRSTFRRMKSAYASDKRKELPTVMAEEYMEGLQYAIDTYVNSRGEVYHCPMVRVKTGREIGHPDPFGSYLQTTPTGLKKETLERAHKVVETAIHALGLRSVTAHTEIMKVDDDWKVIEVGARCGGFRDTLHPLSCDINHTMNDILIRIPRNPVIPKKCKGFATAMKWYARKEGKIIEMKGIRKIEDIGSFHHMTVHKKIGDRAVFASNGGRAIFTLYLYNKDRSKLLADIRRIEQMVEVKIANRNNTRSAQPSEGKKTVSKPAKVTSKKVAKVAKKITKKTVPKTTKKEVKKVAKKK